jgi:hypothetical protein
MTIRCNSIRDWRDGFGRQMFNLDFEPLSDAPFHASFNVVLENMRMVRAAFSPGLTIRSDELAKDGDADFGLVISQAKGLSAKQRGHEVQLGRAEATLLRVSDPGVVGSAERFGFVSIMVPFAELEERSRSIGNLVAQRIPRQSEALLLLRAYIRSAEKIWPGAPTEVLGITPRYLQRIFEASGTSFTEQVNELRLKRAFALLMEAADGPRRISEIAFQAGFSDLSHFNRLFRSRFGDTPSGVRAARWLHKDGH